MKRCSHCGAAKPVGEFYRHPRTKDGLQSRCKDCIKVAAAEWHERNRDKVREQRREAAMARLSMRCSDGLLEAVDEARGDVPRERWLRRAVEQALDGGSYGETSRSAHHVVDEPPAPAERPRVVMRPSPRYAPRRDVKPFMKP